MQKFLKIPQKIHLELINKLSKVAGHEISTQKPVVALYTDNLKPKTVIKETIPFTISLKIIKYLGINLIKEAKDVYSENYKTLLKEIKEETHKWKTSHVHGLENVILLR